MTEEFSIKADQPQYQFHLEYHWVKFAPISPTARCLFGFFLMHVNRERSDTKVWATKEHFAAMLGLKKADSIDRYLKELYEIDFLRVKQTYDRKGMRSNNEYTVRTSPPEGFTWPASLKEFYARLEETQGQTVPPEKGVPERVNHVSAGQDVPPKTGSQYPPKRGYVPPKTGVQLDEPKPKELKPDLRSKDQDQKQDQNLQVRTYGSVGTREVRNDGDIKISEVQKPKSASTRGETPAKPAPLLPVGAGSGVEDQERKIEYSTTVSLLEDSKTRALRPGEWRDCWGKIQRTSEFRATEADVEEMTAWYVNEAGYAPEHARSITLQQLLSPEEREARQFLDSIEVELSREEKLEFYPQVTELFRKFWQSGDLAVKLCSGLDRFASPVAGFRKRLGDLVRSVRVA